MIRKLPNKMQGQSLFIVPVLDRRHGVSPFLLKFFCCPEGLKKSCYILLLFTLDPCAENVLIFILSMNNIIHNFYEKRNTMWTPKLFC